MTNLLGKLEAEGYPVLITQATRTWEEQDALYAQGRTAPGQIVTKAPGGFSQHCFGLAVDLCPLVDGNKLDWDDTHDSWKLMLRIAPDFKLAEGAVWPSFPDTPHFYPCELQATTQQLRAIYARGGQKAVDDWFTATAH